MRDFIRKEIEKAMKKLYPEIEPVEFSVFSDGRFGDYSSNVGLISGGREPAEKIKEELLKSKRFNQFISKIEIVGPGFMNFTLSEDGLLEGLKELGAKPKKRKEKVNIEFISANPTGELHIGHGRSVFYGDALANVLVMAGHKVEREYFINDSKESTQIKELGKTVLGKGTSYLTDYLKKKISARGGSAIGGKNKDEGAVGYAIAKEIQKDNEKFIKSIGIKFDKWFSEEKNLRAKNEFKKTLNLLKKKNLVYEKEYAVWLKTSQYGDDDDRVILRSDGFVSYFLSDIAYHLNKFKRGYKKIIDIWGADHHGHVKRMMAFKKMLGLKGDLKILISQLVILKEGGEKKKLSKRKGTIILLSDLIKEVGLDAARWFYLEKSLSAHMEFNMVLAKERSVKNPVYYVQYAGARMSSILCKASQKLRLKIAYPCPRSARARAHTYNFQSELLLRTPIRNLILKLIQFPEVVEDTAKDYQVQRFTTYAYELASEFSQFYRDVKVIGSKNEKELLALVSLSRKILEDALKLLGISAPEKM